MNNTIKEYITKNMRKLNNRYVEEFKEDLEIDLSTLNETTTFPEHLIFIARKCGTFLLFRNKNNRAPSEKVNTFFFFWRSDKLYTE